MFDSSYKTKSHDVKYALPDKGDKMYSRGFSLTFLQLLGSAITNILVKDE